MENNTVTLPVVAADAHREVEVLVLGGKLVAIVVADMPAINSRMHYTFEVVPEGNLRLVEMLQYPKPTNRELVKVSRAWYSEGSEQGPKSLLHPQDAAAIVPRRVVWSVRDAVLDYFTNRLKMEVAS